MLSLKISTIKCCSLFINIRADWRNLPKVSLVTVWKFFHNDDRFNAPEIRSSKTFKSGREEYGDTAIGYVCLRRERQNCIVKAAVCPEHKVRDKPYIVSITINEEEEQVLNLTCYDCPAANGGCKHAVAILMWLHRRSSEPSPTEVKCYSRKSVLSAAVTSVKYKTAQEINGYETPLDESKLDNSNFLSKIVKHAEEKQLDSQLSRHCFKLKEREVLALSLHQLLIDFMSTGKSSADDFIAFASSRMDDRLCKEAEMRTRDQSDNVLWYKLRYGRITASKLYEAAHCKTGDGSFVRTVIGAAKVFDTQ
ncbi:uncharacterized protein LOC103317369 [Nasonia vitripennis]|uniref:SWIM-type domain-containing protein n=1 Tax=Nasonia vitripennis TaxID=7425 RepID=A0A7M7H9Z2_NASVI|nr:uncharacterized protein LOC103317369 [Nasonia vitripennis]